MDGKDEILNAIVDLKEATEMRFNAIDAHLAAHDAEFAAHRTRFDRLERQMRDGFAGVNQRLDRLERQHGSPL